MSQLRLFQKKAKKVEQKIPIDVQAKATALMAEMIIEVQKYDKGALSDRKPKNH